jgi:very-short-patch-repair endonuclease
VECDGATYHRSKSARDRDRLREEVLNDKGWDIVRVWSTDWFDNPSLRPPG